MSILVLIAHILSCTRLCVASCQEQFQALVKVSSTEPADGLEGEPRTTTTLLRHFEGTTDRRPLPWVVGLDDQLPTLSLVLQSKYGILAHTRTHTHSKSNNASQTQVRSSSIHRQKNKYEQEDRCRPSVRTSCPPFGMP